MLIKVLIPLWKRPEVTRICFKGIKRLQKTIKIEPVCIYSELESRELCQEFGFESYYFENSPLGRKMNFGLDRCLESEWDYLIQIGSDDLLSEELFDIYKDHYGRLSFGVGCIYFYDVKSQKSAVHSGGQVYGCGRMISREILDKEIPKAKFRYSHTSSGVRVVKKGQIDLLPLRFAERREQNGLGKIIEIVKEGVTLWDDDRQTSLDLNSEKNLNMVGVMPDLIDIKNKPLILDIKSEVNIHSIKEYKEIDFDVLNNFPEGDDIRRLL